MHARYVASGARCADAARSMTDVIGVSLIEQVSPSRGSRASAAPAPAEAYTELVSKLFLSAEKGDLASVEMLIRSKGVDKDVRDEARHACAGGAMICTDFSADDFAGRSQTIRPRC